MCVRRAESAAQLAQALSMDRAAASREWSAAEPQAPLAVELSALRPEDLCSTSQRG